MKKLLIQETKRRLLQPNGPANLPLDAAEEALRQIIAEELDEAILAAALSAWVRAAKQKEPRERISEALPSARMEVLLLHAAPKVRKNAARLAGQLKRTEDIAALKKAFQEENVRMVRPSQILALGALGAIDILQNYQVPEAKEASEEKHVKAEQEALATALSANTTVTHHKVRGIPRDIQAELVTAEEMEPTLVRELAKAGLSGKRVAKGRVQVKLTSYQALLTVRCWRELLFPLLTFEAPEEKWAAIIAKRAGERFTGLLQRVYDGEPPYSYRIEMKAKADRSKRARETAAALASGLLVNSTSDYENELRIEQHGRSVTVYAKLCALPDSRFSYRKGSVAASIHPSVAAAVMSFAGPYLTEGADVLDPCCGSATMLIERARWRGAAQDGPTTGRLYGVDLSEKALDIAKTNVEAADLSARLLQKDCTEFNIREPFDEVISNLPFGNRVGDHETNEILYDKLLGKLPQWLKPGGVAILYTMEVNLMKRLIREHSDTLRLMSQVRTEAGGLNPGIFIIRTHPEEGGSDETA